MIPFLSNAAVAEENFILSSVIVLHLIYHLLYMLCSIKFWNASQCIPEDVIASGLDK